VKAGMCAGLAYLQLNSLHLHIASKHCSLQLTGY
jgi:hypothetical protein